MAKNRSRLGEGFAAPFFGLHLTLRHGSILWVSLPAILIEALILSLLVMLWASKFPAILEWVWSRPQGENVYGQILKIQWWALTPVLVVGAISLGVLALTALGNLLASPFHERISTKAEQLFGADVSLTTNARHSWILSLRSEAIRFLLLLVALLLGGLVHWIPIVGNILYLAYFLVVCMLYLAMTFFNHPWKARSLRFASRFAFGWRHRRALLGFGAGVVVLALLPLANLVCLPAAITGASKLYRELREIEGKK